MVSPTFAVSAPTKSRPSPLTVALAWVVDPVFETVVAGALAVVDAGAAVLLADVPPQAASVSRARPHRAFFTTSIDAWSGQAIRCGVSYVTLGGTDLGLDPYRGH